MKTSHSILQHEGPRPPQRAIADKAVAQIAPEDVGLARRDHPRIGATLDAAIHGALGHFVLAAELRGATGVDRELLVHGIKRRVVFSVLRVWSMPAIVATTELICTLPRQFAAQAARYFNLAIHEAPAKFSEQHMFMMWHVKMDADPGHKWLCESLLAMARERLGVPSAVQAENVMPFVRPSGRRAGGAGPTPPRSA